jgi:hypothetical protein
MKIKANIKSLVAHRKRDLKYCAPKQRDKMRHKLRVAQMVAQLRKENAA